MKRAKLFISVLFICLCSIPASPSAGPFKELPLEASMQIWVQEAIRNSLAYDYKNYKERIEENRKFHTESGFKRYVNTIEGKGIYLDDVIDGQWALVGVPDIEKSFSPRFKIKDKKIDEDGLHTWKIDYIVNLHYMKNLKTTGFQHRVWRYIAILEVKQTTLDAPYGFLINKWYLRDNYDPYRN